MSYNVNFYHEDGYLIWKCVISSVDFFNLFDETSKLIFRRELSFEREVLSTKNKGFVDLTYRKLQQHFDLSFDKSMLDFIHSLEINM